MVQRIVFVGTAAKQVARLHEACTNANGKAVVVFNPKPDGQEVGEAFKQISFPEGTRLIDGSNTEAVLEAIEHNTRNVLIVNANKLSVHTQMEMQKKNRLDRWVLLTSKKPEELTKLGTPWAISFVRNVVGVTIGWKNIDKRPKQDIIDQITITLHKAGINVPEGLLESGMREMSKKQIANALEVNSMAQTMIVSVRQSHRSVLKPMDIIAGMIFKDNATASSGSTAASVMEVRKMTLALDERDDDDGDHIRATTMVRMNRWNEPTTHDRRRRRPSSEHAMN